MNNSHKLKFAIIFILSLIGFVFRVSGWECGNKVVAITCTLISAYSWWCWIDEY